jgi:hypothetical protein
MPDAGVVPGGDASTEPRIVVDVSVSEWLRGVTVADPVAGACGSGAEVELVTSGLAPEPELSFAAMPRVDSPPKLFVSRMVEPWELFGITKASCELESVTTDAHGSVVATASHVFWRGPEQVFRRGVTGGPIEPLAREPFYGAVAATATHVYQEFGRSVVRFGALDLVEELLVGELPSGGGLFATLSVTEGDAVFGGHTGPILDEQQFGWITYLDFESGAAEPLVLAWSVYGQSAVLFDEHVYYCRHGIVRVPKRGGTHVMIVAPPCDGATPGSVHVDESGIYWNANATTLAHSDLAGTNPKPIARARQFTVDDTHVYWVDLGGDLLRAPKPN